MILANNTKRVSGQLFRCDKAELGTLGREHLRHLTFITVLIYYTYADLKLSLNVRVNIKILP